MLANTELGPACPVCSSEMWEFDDVGDFTGENNRQPQHEVNAAAECFDCESMFELELKLDDDSMFRELNLKAVSPPQGFGWGTPSLPAVENKHFLYIWGDMNDSEGSQYLEEYHLQSVTVKQDNKD